MNAASRPPWQLLPEVRDKFGGEDRFTPELQQERYEAMWTDDSGQEHPVSAIYWDSVLGRQSMKTGIIDSVDRRGRGFAGALLYVRPVEAVAQPAKRGGRPTEHDWQELLIYLTGHFYEHGYPANQTELVGIMQAWFDTRTKGKRIPATSEMYSLARRIFEERDKRDSEN
jgi:hypothetical protein